MIISLIQHFEADFLLKVSLIILNSGLIMKAFTHVFIRHIFAHKPIMIAACSQFLLITVKKSAIH